MIGAGVEEAFELVDVVVQDRHQGARRVVMKVCHLEVLDVGVGVESKLVLDGLGEVAPVPGVDILEGGFEAPDEDRGDGQGDELVHGVHDTEAGEQ